MPENNGLKGFSKQFRDKILKTKLPTPPDVVKGLAGMDLSTSYTSYLEDIGNEIILNDYINANPGSIDDDSKYRNELLNRNQPTSNDLIQKIDDKTQPDPLSKGYLDGINRQIIITDNTNVQREHLDDHSVYRDKLLSNNEVTPVDIVDGIKQLTQSESETVNYLDGINKPATMRSDSVKNPGTVDDHSKYREKILKRNEAAPQDVIDGLRILTESETAVTNYLADIGKTVVIDDHGVINPGSVDDHNEMREKLLKQNQNIPSEILVGLEDLSQTQLTTKSYTNNIDKPVDIRTSSVKNPGNIDDDVQYREKMMAKNQKIQTDVLAGLTEMSITKSTARSYLDSVGKSTVISDLVVKNPGEISTYGDQQRLNDLSRNKKIDVNDVSEGGSALVDSSIGSVSYKNWLYDIGKDAKIGDYFIINQTDLDTNLVVDPESGAMVNSNLAMTAKLNLYGPENGFEVFNETIQAVKNSLNEKSIGFWNETNLMSFQPRQYTPSDFIPSNTTTTENTPDYNFNDIFTQTSYINANINNDSLVIKDDSLMMNIGAMELMYNFGARISQAVLRDTLLSSNIDEALSNPLTAIDIIKGNTPLFERNYTISKSTTDLGAGFDLLSRLTGTLSTTELFGLGSFFRDPYKNTLTPRTLDNKSDKKTVRVPDSDNWLLARTGDGQQHQLFLNIAFNKYRPDYISSNNDNVLGSIQKTINGITGFTDTTGNYYLGDKSVDTVADILQQPDGFYQENGNEKLTQVWATNYKKGQTNGTDYTGENLVKIGGYGILSSEFIWVDEKTFTGIDRTQSNLNNTVFSYDKRDSFRNDSLLNFTQKMVESNTVVGRTINQLNEKFNDGYTTISRGSAVKGFTDVLDQNGHRVYSAMLQTGEYCRVWTKTRPYGNITTTMRYDELLRRERNSVLDRYNNLNIFPSKLNVNQGYGNPLLTVNDNGKQRALTTEFYGEERARKYMFSIENLAWIGSDLERTLPPSEKGPNGGRIMWFPPYDIKFTDNNTSNWNSTIFLGRPEPIYTYNNSERTGTLNFKIIVDHPSILNVLVQTELKKLSDNDVDTILDSFWSGCTKFDIFDLARIWGVFSVDEIEYFKNVIDAIYKSNNNSEVVKKIKRVKDIKTEQDKQPEKVVKSQDIVTEIITNDLVESYMYFENDVPSADTSYNNIKRYSEYFNEYRSKMENTQGIDNNVKYYDKEGKQHPFVERYDLALKTEYNKIIDTNFFEYSKGQYDNLKNNWKKILDSISNNDLTIDFETFTSPLAANSYNEKLAIRRFVSAVKELISLTAGAKLNPEGTTPITDSNINQCFASDYKSAVFYLQSSNNIFNKITIKSIEHKEATLFEDTSKIIPLKTNTDSNTNVKYYAMNYSLPSGGQCEIRIIEPDSNSVDSSSDVNIKKYYDSIKDSSGNYTTDGHKMIIIENPLANDCVALASLTGKYLSKYREASLVSAVVSPVAAMSRCGHFCNMVKTVTTNIKPDNKTVVDNSKPKDLEPIITAEVIDTKFSSITKRDIAQRILNKLISEYNYFEYLDETYPGVFTSVKEKLRYFSPGFHSMTPEGLNGRLTFLQQCLRPGATITTNSEGCDANNTAFGRPPICVLRIGDFYHSKIVIDYINFDYDPLVFDINPEGIGVQPMVANVSMSFKFIGGQGLRKAVEQLQNALSFNYYGNTDVYDDRTFANKDEFERSLLNFETSFFDNNGLDIQRIVDNAEKIKYVATPRDLPSGTIGVAVNDGLEQADTPQVFPCEFVLGDSYVAGDYVFYGEESGNPIVWKCIAPITGEESEDTTPGVLTTYWEKQSDYDISNTQSENSITTYAPFLVPTRGLYPYEKEFNVSNRNGWTSNTYMEYYKLDYRPLFENIYDSLGFLHKRKINRYNSLSDKFTNVSLNNPFLTAGILMRNPKGVSLQNGLYNNKLCDGVVNEILGLPEAYKIDSTVIESVSFPSVSGDTATNSSDIIESKGGIVTVKPYINKYAGQVGGDKYYPNYMLDNEYYELGVDNHPINNTKLPQLLMLHLYPQEGNYKLPTASTELTDEILNDFAQYAAQSQYYAKIDNPINQFIPNSFSSLLIPTPDNYVNKTLNLTFFRDSIYDLINTRNLSALRRDFSPNGNNYVLNVNGYTSSDTELSKLSTKLIENFNNNFNKFVTAYQEYNLLSEQTEDSTMIQKFMDADNSGIENGAFKLCVKSFDALSLVLNGIDVSKDHNDFTYYEIVPNATTQETDNTWEDHFGYNPYKQIYTVNPVFYVPSGSTMTLSGADKTSVDYRIHGFSENKLPQIGTDNTYNISDFNNYKSDIDQVFGSLAIQENGKFKIPYDYSLYQLTAETYGITGNTKTGKTRYYGLQYVSGSTITSNGTLIDYFGTGSYDDTINTSFETQVDSKVLNSVYNISDGTVYKTPINKIDTTGLVYTYRNNTSTPKIKTVFERFGHEVVYIANKFDGVISCNHSNSLMNINTIYNQNVFAYNSVDAENFLNKYFLLDVATYTTELYAELGIRSYSSYPISDLCVDEKNIAGIKLKELSDILYFDYYINEKNTTLEYSIKSVYRDALIKKIRSFEEIMFANLIYVGADKIVTDMINDLKKQKSTPENKTTTNYLQTVLNNIKIILSKLDESYNAVDTEYRKHVNEQLAKFEDMKPTILPASNVNDYRLKVKKTKSTSTLNKFLFTQYRP